MTEAAEKAAEAIDTNQSGNADSTSKEKEPGKGENSNGGSSENADQKPGEEQSAASEAVSDSNENGGDPDLDEEDDGIEWQQTRSAAANAKGEGLESKSETKNEDVESLKKVIDEKDAEIQELKKKIESYQGLDAAFDDAIIKTWLAHKERHGSQASPTLYLQELGQIKFVDTRSEEEKIRAYYEADAKRLGLTGDLLTQSVQEDLDNYATLSIREKHAVIKEAEKLIATTEVTSIEELEKQHRDHANKLQSENRQWMQRQVGLFQDYIKKVVQKGTFQNRPVDSNWEKRVTDLFLNSPIAIDPNFIVLADPDENGSQDLFIPEMVAAIDAIAFRKERDAYFQKKIKESRAKNLGERAEQKEQAAIKAELRGEKLTPDEERQRKLEEANAIAFGRKF